MQKATIILGPQGSGKSKKAFELTGGNCTVIDFEDIRRKLTPALREAIITGLPIVVEGVRAITPFIKQMASVEKIGVRYPYARNFQECAVPQLIFTSQNLTEDDFLDSRRFNIITLPAR